MSAIPTTYHGTCARVTIAHRVAHDLMRLGSSDDDGRVLAAIATARDMLESSTLDGVTYTVPPSGMSIDDGEITYEQEQDNE